MDPSKLPPASQTPHVPAPNHDPNAPIVTNVRHYGAPLPASFVPMECWMSFIIGVIVLFMFPTFGQFLYYHSEPDKFDALHPVFDKTGSLIYYKDSGFFYPGMGMTAFGLVLILDALALIRARWRMLLWPAFVLTTLCVILNIFAIIKGYDDIGFQLPNALAVAIGGYIALYDWRLLQMTRLS